MPPSVEFVAYPPASFPLRDLLVLEQVSLGKSDRVCEVGIGSGGTTARLAKICGSVTGLEISNATVHALRYLEARHENLELVVADVTRPEQVRPFEGEFTRVVSCDTLEHVGDPAGFFRGIAALLAPGGEFMVTFPNEPEPVMHGITRFEDKASLTALLEGAGLSPCRLGAAELAPRAGRVAESFGWRPLSVVRKVLRRPRGGTQGDRAASPQTFEQTHFSKHMATYKRLSPVLNLYWYGVLRMMSSSSPSFVIDLDFQKTVFASCQVFIAGTKSG